MIPEDNTPKISDNQARILLYLMHNTSMTFNQLWDKEGRSNKFAYHLKAVEKQGLVKKTTQGYSLTKKGKEHVTYLERKTGEHWKFPVLAIAAVIIDENNKKVLMLKRTKEPFIGYWGFHGGKLRSTEYILESAEQAIAEETGLTCQVELKGLFSSKTYQDKELLYNHQLFVVKASKARGTLKEKTKKGTNKWVKITDIKKENILPNIPHLLKIAQGKKFRWIEADRTQENNTFSIDVKKDEVL